MNIVKPTLLLNQERAIRNIKRMAQKAKDNGVCFRPHFKTHQSAAIGEWFKAFGVNRITVSSVDMAEYFAQHGWQDITIAFPVNVCEIEKINMLAREITLHLLVESEETVRFLQQHLSSPVNMWIKIDTGSHRTGLLWDDFEALSKLVSLIHQSNKLSLCGLLTHAGHTYQGRSPENISETYGESVSRMKTAQQHLQTMGFSPVEISVGDTPGCSIVEDLSGVDEIRPGNFVFYDVTQLNIGSCTEDDIAVAVACPVVAKHSERQEIVIYGGAVHLSKDSITVSLNNRAIPIFGYIALLEPRGWGPIIPDTYLVKLSQEHGIIQTVKQVFEQIHVGDLLCVLPVHSCLTANLLRKYYTPDGTMIELADLS